MKTKILKLSWYSGDGSQGGKTLAIPDHWTEQDFINEMKLIAPDVCENDGYAVNWRSIWNYTDWPEHVSEITGDMFMEINADEILCDCGERPV